MICLMDYGRGNIYSIRNALENVGAKVKLAQNPDELDDADAIVIPGVGSFGDAMEQLIPFKERIQDSITEGIPFLGICLGMQILFEKSEESREKGFRLIKGDVVRLPDNVLVPQMGWNGLDIRRDTEILEGIEDGDFFYFVHSYHCIPGDGKIVVATTEYGTEVVSVIDKDNVHAVQFHPEKSGVKGLMLLKNFLGSVKC
jgi:glutamine amidotransferase